MAVLEILIFITSFFVIYWVLYGQKKFNESLMPKRKTELKAIIFDLDGVIIDSFDRQFQIFNELRKRYGLHDVNEKMFREKIWGNSLETIANEFFKKQSYDEIKKRHEFLVRKYINKVKLMDNAKEVIQKIKRSGIKTGLVTNATKNRTKKELEFLKIKDKFDIILTADDVEKPKPYPDGILKACERLNVQPDEVIYVGDRENDYKAGKSAGTFVVGLNTKGDLVISELKDLMRLL